MNVKQAVVTAVMVAVLVIAAQSIGEAAKRGTASRTAELDRYWTIAQETLAGAQRALEE